MNEKKNYDAPFGNSTKEFVNRTKWEKDNKEEKKSYLVRTAEEREARRALRDFKRDYQWEHLDDRDPSPND